MLRRILISSLLAGHLPVASLLAQTGLAQTAGSSLVQPAKTSSLPVAPARTSPLRSWLTPVLGGIGGGLAGAEGISYAKVDPGSVTIHRVRAGLTYGAMGAATSSALMLKLSGPEPIEPHRFWLGRVSTPLLASMVAVQALDYTGTQHFRARGRNEWLLTNGAVDNRPTLVATEVSALVSAVSFAYILHRTGHHKLERWFEGGYVAVGAASAIRNYSLGPPTSSAGSFISFTPQGGIRY